MEAIIGIPNLDLFLTSNFPVPKNTSNVYTAVLKSWKEFKYETFNSKEDILKQYLWYNNKLKINNKTIYLKSFDDCGIRNIADITNEFKFINVTFARCSHQCGTTSMVAITHEYKL